MTKVAITQEVVEVTITPEGQPAVALTVPAAAQVLVQPVGAQGPPGPSADTVSLAAQGAISALRVVSRSANGVEISNPTSADSLARVIGIATMAAASGNQIMVRQSGFMADQAWSWTPGQPLFCGADGVLTASAPIAVGSRQIAVAISATAVLVEISDLILME